MFAALIARTDVDLIALDKGEIKPSKVVDQLIAKMEEYANFGFDYITIYNYFKLAIIVLIESSIEVIFSEIAVTLPLILLSVKLDVISFAES